MINLFSDLDNTLVYSHRIALPCGSVAVEYLNGRVQSRMTEKTYAFLAGAAGVFLIPTTTRTCEQYARLSETFAGFGCRYALVCNGGVMLDRGAPDPQWLAETKEIAGNELSSLKEAGKVLRGLFPERYIRIAEGIMLYFKTDAPAPDAAAAAALLDTEALRIYYDSRKVYCIPTSINKGSALRRFSERMGITCSAAAGDSAPDIPMLEAADIALLPEKLCGLVSNANKIVLDGEAPFSDLICDYIGRMAAG